MGMARGGAHPSLGVYRLIGEWDERCRWGSWERGRPSRGPGRGRAAGWYHRQPIRWTRRVARFPRPGTVNVVAGRVAAVGGGPEGSVVLRVLRDGRSLRPRPSLFAKYTRARGRGPWDARTHSQLGIGRTGESDGRQGGQGGACMHAIAGNTVISLYKYGYGMCAVAGAV